MYIGEDVADMFVRKLQLEAEQLIDEYIATPKPMLLTATESQFLSVLPLGDDRVRDIATLQEITVVLLTMRVICCIEYPEPVGS